MARGGIHERVRTHPRFAERGYSSATAIDLDEFLAVLAEEVTAWNQKPKRRTLVCGGILSYAQAFDASYSTAIVQILRLLVTESLYLNHVSQENDGSSVSSSHLESRYLYAKAQSDASASFSTIRPQIAGRLGYKTTVGSKPEAANLVDTVGDLLFLGGSNKPTLTSLSLPISLPRWMRLF